MLNRIGLAAACGLLLGFASASCGGSGARNLCTERNVRCDEPEVCDPTDGVCKCGGRGGVKCLEGFACDALTNTCLTTKCSRVDCSDKPGTSCDVNDGVCKCGGTGGAVCGASERCDSNARTCVAQTNCNQVACGKNQTCEFLTGKCKCGAAECSVGQTCAVDGNDAKSCVADTCNGVSCTGDNVCDPTDGYCKCNGVVCQSGEACSCPGGADAGCASTERACRPGGACANKVCPNNGTTCDPVDGQCKCGGPGGPVCSSVQICALGPTPQCQGGQQCTNPDGGAKVCVGGTSCDPEDGLCKCGGRGGIVCAPEATLDGGAKISAEVCIRNPLQQSCRRPCSVLNPDCANGTYCYFDSSAASPAAYCSPATDSRHEEDSCTSPTACFSTTPTARPVHCNGLVVGQTGVCRAYCNVQDNTQGCIQVPRPQVCVQISGAPKDFGYCQPR